MHAPSNTRLIYFLLCRHYVLRHWIALSYSRSPSPAAWPRHRPRLISASPASQTSATTPTRSAIACRRVSSSTKSGRSASPWASTRAVYPSSHSLSTGATSCASWGRIRSCWSEQTNMPPLSLESFLYWAKQNEGRRKTKGRNHNNSIREKPDTP